MRKTIFAVLAATALLGACEQSRVDTGVAGGAGSAYGQDGTMGGRSGVGQEGLGGPGGVGGGRATAGTLDGTTPDRVFFTTDQYSLTPDGRATLDQQAAWLNRYPQVRIVMEGHADERGTREYNLALGDRRAAAARDYLVSRGISASRIRTISYGKERPAVNAPSESGWAQNRRAVTVPVQ
jgi:peptidoglycan-associated lipoprotein